MFSYANRAICARFTLSSTFYNVVRLQPLQCLRSKEPSTLCLRHYINNHGSHKLASFSKETINVLALDENEKEIGVVKFSRLRSLAVEKGMVVESVNQEAQPHPIYKLTPAKEPTQSDNTKPSDKVKSKQKTIEKVKKVNKKLLRLKPTICHNDLKVKIDHVLEWLAKDNIVNIKIAIKPGDKKHLQVYEEIVRTASSVGNISKPTSTEKELAFELVSSASAEKAMEKTREKHEEIHTKKPNADFIRK